MTFQLNGSDLSTSTVEVTLEPGMGQEDQARNWQTQPPDAFPEVHGVGHQARPFTAILRFTGPAPDRYERLEYVRGLLQSLRPVVLTATAGEVYFQNGARSIALQYDGASQPFEDGVSTTALNVRFLTLGVPLAYVEGGAYVECDSLGVHFLANDFFTATDNADYADGVLYGVPVQKAGFPKATSPSALRKHTATPSLLSAEIGLNSDGTESIVEVYDLSGLVTDEPHNADDGGSASVCQCVDRATLLAYGDLVYVQVATLGNDFSITAASVGFLAGVGDGEALSILYGPTGATLVLVSTETALNSDGTSSTVNVYQVTGDDGAYIMEVA